MVTILARIFADLFPINLHDDQMIIGSIMPLLPGMVFTNAIRDILYGDYTAGLARMTEAVLIAASSGAWCWNWNFYWIITEIGDKEETMNVIQVIAAFIGVCCYGFSTETPRRFIVYAGIGGGFAWMCYLIAFDWLQSVVFANFIGAFSVGIYSHVMARKMKTPVTVFSIRRNSSACTRTPNLSDGLLFNCSAKYIICQ